MTTIIEPELLLSDDRGIYIPKAFAETIAWEQFEGIDDTDIEILEAGPDHEWYWESWMQILDNATIELDVDGHPVTWTLYQDGDLFLIPAGWDVEAWAPEEGRDHV